MVFKEISSHDWKKADWEEVPDEDLWEDGELNTSEVHFKIINHVTQSGDWILVREVNDVK